MNPVELLAMSSAHTPIVSALVASVSASARSTNSSVRACEPETYTTSPLTSGDPLPFLARLYSACPCFRLTFAVNPSETVL